MQLDFRKNPGIVEKVIDAMADGLFTVDAEGRFISWNAGAERITGYSEAEVVGSPCTIMEGANCKGFAALMELLLSPKCD